MRGIYIRNFGFKFESGNAPNIIVLLAEYPARYQIFQLKTFAAQRKHQTLREQNFEGAYYYLNLDRMFLN